MLLIQPHKYYYRFVALLTEEGESPNEICAQNLAKLVRGMTPESAKNAEDLIRVMLDKGMLK